MKKTNEMKMLGQFVDFNIHELQTAVADWFILLRIVSNPQTFQIGEEEMKVFSPEMVLEHVRNIQMEDDFEWKVLANEGRFRIHVFKGTLFIENIYTWEAFEKNQLIILDYFEHRMQEFGFYGYIRSMDEYNYHNVSSLEERKIFEDEEELKQHALMYSQKHELQVDCSQFSGFDSFYRGYLLTSCWKFYMGGYYSKIIPPQMIRELQQVEGIKDFGGNLFCITLYKHPQNWDKPVNLKYQRNLRDQLGIDFISWNNGVGSLKEPMIEFSFTDREVHTVQYLSQQGQPIEKKKASNFITRTYDFENDEYFENRMHGRLNTQAFFPWVNGEEKIQMNYKVLHPEMTLDDGLSAYEYYIREYLELENIEDSAKEKFESILIFYLAEENLRKLPIQNIKDRLTDVFFKQKKVKAENNGKKFPGFKLKKGKNKLTVIFYDFEQMNH
ncbi:MAG: hypothetical protein LBD38_00930 [Streptococcaceae bacterium]|jgi:hypothetical protein|nr:hypothetical protein [Streptococcaceae bacterium]